MDKRQSFHLSAPVTAHLDLKQSEAKLSPWAASQDHNLCGVVWWGWGCVACRKEACPKHGATLLTAASPGVLMVPVALTW